ncbi:unnamed protein product [Dovyalis caffra]|uniref:Uncharacterized protein n=1 Tax=Dovyalis caffra TaxID=77055 RepID=A0AAV1R107_9ROSI|nr:unnamed protein product [Dovyalis caffra]
MACRLKFLQYSHCFFIMTLKKKPSGRLAQYIQILVENVAKKATRDMIRHDKRRNFCDPKKESASMDGVSTPMTQPK